jgi:hypothetical protein
MLDESGQGQTIERPRADSAPTAYLRLFFRQLKDLEMEQELVQKW